MKFYEEVDKILNPTSDLGGGLSQLEGDGMKPNILSEFIDIWITIEVLRSMKLSETTDTLTDASILENENFNGDEKHNAQHYRNAFDKLYTN